MKCTLPPYGRKESFNLVREIIMSADYPEPVIVEIGMTRTVGNWLGDGYSTPFFAYIVNMCSGELYSVDIDPDAVGACKSILDEYGLFTDRVNLIAEDGISFLERWGVGMSKGIDLLYLDGWDYAEGPQAQISEEAHLKAFQTAENDLSPKALVLIDDVYDTATFKGKGRLVIPYLLQKGYKPLHMGYQCLFSKSTNRENYGPEDALSPSTKQDPVDELTRQAHEESVREGTIDLPRNFGDILLREEGNNESVRVMISEKRREGVLDDDIRWWWNMGDVQRRLIIKIDKKNKEDELGKLVKLYDLPESEAALIIRKTNPFYGDPTESEEADDDDRPLPYELMWRITRYVQTLQSDPAALKDNLKRFSSFNAFIREESRRGRL